jgi:hypothetical protein
MVDFTTGEDEPDACWPMPMGMRRVGAAHASPLDARSPIHEEVT